MIDQAAVRRIEHKQDVILRALHAILSAGQFDMAKIHDDIAAALASNDSALAANATKMDTLIALKTEGDSAFSDILTSVQGQGETIANQGSVLDQALAAGGATDTTGPTSTTVTVSQPTAANTTTIPINTTNGTAPVTGEPVSGPGIATGTTVADGSTASTLVVDQPTVQGHDGGETLAIGATGGTGQ